MHENLKETTVQALLHVSACDIVKFNNILQIEDYLHLWRILQL